MRQLSSLLVLTVIGVAIWTGLSYLSITRSMPKTLQSMIDQNIRGNQLKVSFVKVPLLAAIPLVGPAKTEGYFMIERKGGGQIGGNCALEAIDFELREAANDKMTVWIAGDGIQKLAQCALL
ncbi:hypothetical protein NKI72_31280 [Mesorhizobium sp. M0437]|uniref:hypothetical protein n=1 Tax=Mesorhizobium sp. M0437 TaxID=2956945 RepID=UPI00333918F7